MKKALAFILTALLLFSFSACSGILSDPPDVKKTETVFSENNEAFRSIKDYLLDLKNNVPDLNSVYIEEDTVTVFRRIKGSDTLDRKDIPVKETIIADSYQKLLKAGCLDIGMQPKKDESSHGNVIYFCMWSRSISEADSGIAYAVDASMPPQVQFQTELEPLSEAGWYYYLSEYEVWRNTQPNTLT